MSDVAIREQAGKRTLRQPTAVLATLGWLLAGVTLLLQNPRVGVVTLVVALPLWVGGLPAPAFAVAQVGIGTIGIGEPLITLASLQVGPAVLVLALVAEDGFSVRTAGITLAITGGLLGVIVGAFVLWNSILIAGVTLLATAALLSYFMHRYELHTLGLIQ